MSTLVVAAHADDEALGCGGTIHKLSRTGEEVHILFLADGESSRVEGSIVPKNKTILRKHMARQAAEILGARTPIFMDLPDNRLDQVGLLQITKTIEEVILEITPSTIFTHAQYDLNIDHRLVAQAVLTASRPQPDS